VKLLLAALLGSLAVAGGSPHVVARAADGEVVAELRLAQPAFSVEYRHSYYGAPARESFRVREDGSFELAAVSSPSEAVLDYYEIDGTRERRGRLVDAAARAAGALRRDGAGGHRNRRRTLVAGDRRVALWGDAVHLRLAVER
jgi:hypothetical protein